jgi:hypothetical protein
MTRCKNYDGDYVSPICDGNEADHKYKYSSGDNSHIVALCEKCAKNIRNDLHSYESLEQV